MGKITVKDVKNLHEVQVYLERADRNMEIIGYTEHGFRHAEIVSARAEQLLRQLGHDDRTCELAAIAGYIHDLGNCANRLNHSLASVMMAMHILDKLGMPPEDLAEIVAGVGNHEEENSEPFGPVAAAVTIADKSDMDRSRVRNLNRATFDAHDRINWATVSSDLQADLVKRVITLSLKIDTAIGSIMEYFELFLTRMVVSRQAARQLGCEFSLVINDTRLL